jgi:hypothetical protein
MDSRPGWADNVRVFLCLSGVSVFLLLSSCAAISGRGDHPPTRSGETRPTWRTGDRWLHAWTSGVNKGVKTAECIGVRDVGGVSYNVLRTDAAQLYYTPDLHWAAIIVESRVVARATPPQPWFNWPLEVGKRWQYQGVYEAQELKDPIRDSYQVVEVESVTVPAGTFRAYRIVREVNSAVVDEYWYAPDVRWYVKWVGRRGKDEFQEVLQEFAPAAQIGTPAPVTDRPATPSASPPRR